MYFLGHFLTIELSPSLLVVAISVTAYVIIDTHSPGNTLSIIIDCAPILKLNSYFDQLSQLHLE